MRSIINYFRFALERMNRRNRARFFSLFLAALASGAVAILAPMLQKRLMDGVSLQTLDGAALLALLGVGLLGIMIKVAGSLMETNVTLGFQNRLQREMMESAPRQRNKVLKARGPGAFMVNLFGDSEHVGGLVNGQAFQAALNVLTGVIILIIAARWTWVFPAIVLPAYALLAGVLTITNRVYQQRFKLFREQVMAVNPRVLEYLENRATLLGYADVRRFEAGIYALFDARDGHLAAAVRAKAFAESAVEAIKTGALVLFFVLAMGEIIAGRLTIAMFVALTAYFSQIFSPVALVQSLSMSMKRFQTLHERIVPSLRGLPLSALPAAGDFRFDNCAFSYQENKKEQTIAGFSTEIDGLIGVVGVSGEGKTTLLRLLLGELEPTAGACLLGGVPTGQIAPQVVYAAMKYYGQDPALLDGDLLQNIALGKQPLSAAAYDEAESTAQETLFALFTRLSEGQPPRTAQEKDALQNLYLLDETQCENPAVLRALAAGLPQDLRAAAAQLAPALTAKLYYQIERYEGLIDALGLRPLAGRVFGRGGEKISGGEKNRVCLARMLLPQNPGYWIIDEPFTGLDAIAERQCLEALKTYTKGGRGLLISHKLHVVKALADRVIVLHQGKIEAEGTHEAVLEASPLYKQLWEERAQ
ncbi:MAG: ABC transporter ATP-binding protein/permease [Oscillospiraceae bacterium]|jgi:ABC-type multidrug transport system fused ATPase/permease subunit|nr:ABC transporter ATP-binding protein/permease [Oscillospiraceae bacterium]